MHQRGFSLVEILIAGTVMVAVTVPLVGLLTTQKTDARSEDLMAEAVALAQDVMEKILSPRIPFDAINPNGGSGLVQGGPGKNVAQAGFTQAILEELVSDGTEPRPDLANRPCRYKAYKGRTFYVYFFAGKYPLHPAKAPNVPEDPGYAPPDVDHTLTFAYLEKPAEIGLPWNLSPQRNELNRSIILDRATIDVAGQSIATIPYVQRPILVKPGSSPVTAPINGTDPFYYKDRLKTLGTKKDHRLISGWPDPRPGDSRIDYNITATADQRRFWTEHLRRVALREDGKTATVAYHPTVVDQRTLNVRNGGGLMKIVVGVQFNPYATSYLRSGNNTFREFWLASLKANLEN
jgi:hypothetical protein